MRVFGLDALRAYAIFCVVYAHAYALTDRQVPEVLYNIPVLDGVTIFFVLSGFLVGRILLRQTVVGDFDFRALRQFWIRRWFRTLPTYYLILVLLIVLAGAEGSPDPGGLLPYFVFSQNLISPHPGFFPEAWSLSVEEWFYLVFPLVIFLSLKLGAFGSRARTLLFWIAAFIILSTAIRFYRVIEFDYSTVGEWDANLRKQVVTRFDSLMFGVIGAYLSLFEAHRWRRFAGKAFVAGLVLLLATKVLNAFVIDNPAFRNYFFLTLTALGTLLLLPKLAQDSAADCLPAKAITFISLISYSMYLVNFSLIQGHVLPWVMDCPDAECTVGRLQGAVPYALYMGLNLVLASLLYFGFERPFTNLRERFRMPPRK